MSIETIFRSLFPTLDYTGDDEALAQIREEVEVLREQILIRVGDTRRLLAEFVNKQVGPAGLASLLFISRDLAERNQLILSRGKLPLAKSQPEVQRAHDVWRILILDPAVRREVFPGEDPLETFKANEDALCWALGHIHNQTLETNLALAEARMFERGIIIDRCT